MSAEKTPRAIARLVFTVVFVCATAAWAKNSDSTVTCKDGTTSKGGRGACHGHGGVDKTKTAGTSGAEPASSAPAAGAPASAPPPVAMPPKVAPPAAAAPATQTEKVAKGKAATDDPAGALAKCKDGNYWHGTKHSGSCSHHGGVDTWLDGSQKKN